MLKTPGSALCGPQRGCQLPSGQWPLNKRRKGNHRPPRVLPEKSLRTAAGVPRIPSRSSFRVTAVFTKTRAYKDCSFPQRPRRSLDQSHQSCASEAKAIPGPGTAGEAPGMRLGETSATPQAMPTRDSRWFSLCFNLSIPGALYTHDCWFHVPRRG